MNEYNAAQYRSIKIEDLQDSDEFKGKQDKEIWVKVSNVGVKIFLGKDDIEHFRANYVFRRKIVKKKIG